MVSLFGWILLLILTVTICTVAKWFRSVVSGCGFEVLILTWSSGEADPFVWSVKLLFSPGYNRTGWLGVKCQVIYLFHLICLNLLLSFCFMWLWFLYLHVHMDMCVQVWWMSSRRFEPSLPWLWLPLLRQQLPTALSPLTVSSSHFGRVSVSTEERCVLT